MPIPGSTSILSHTGPCFAYYGFAGIGLVFPYVLASNLNPFFSCRGQEYIQF